MTDEDEQKSTERRDNSKQGSLKKFLAGEYIFREGETARHAYVLKSGKLEIYKASASGQFKVSEVEEGALFGEMALIDSAPRSASAYASSDVALAEINKQGFLNYISKNPNMAISLMTRLSGYVRDLNDTISRLERRIDNNSGSQFESDPEEEKALSTNHTLTDSVSDTEAIYEQSASKGLRVMLYGMSSFLMLAFLFSLIVRIDTTVSARGKVTTTVPNVIIQAPVSSRVNILSVSRGDFVSAGNVIAELDDTIVSANLKIIQDKLGVARERKLRLEYERQAISSDQIKLETSGLNAINEDILMKKVQEYKSRIGLFAAQISQIDNQIVAETSDLTMLQEQLDVKEEIEQAWQDLLNNKAGSLIQYLSAKEARLSVSLVFTEAKNQIKQLRSARESTLAERDAFIASNFSELAENYVLALQDYSQLVEEERKLLQQREDLLVLAPVSGTVLNLPAVGPGSIVSQGEELITIVRSDVPLTLDIDIDPKDRGDLRVGQKASVKFDALPFQQYGDISGTLAFISGDTFPDSLDGIQGPYYRGRVELLPGDLSEMPNGVQVSPGMLATSDLLVGDRRLVTYFINPIIRNVKQAFREPD